MSEYHVPVLLNESVSALNIEENRNGIFIDATFGGGGHSREILSRLGEKGKLIAFDRNICRRHFRWRRSHKGDSQKTIS